MKTKISTSILDGGRTLLSDGGLKELPMDYPYVEKYLAFMRIYVDLDDTLIHAISGSGRGIGKRTVVDLGGGDRYHSLLRPATEGFLKRLRTLGEVRMLTTAIRSYALAHNKTFQLGFQEGEIVAREDYIVRVSMAYSTEWVPVETRACPTGCLIDNLDPSAEAARIKMAYLGIKEERYIQIREFDGKDPEGFSQEIEQILKTVGEVATGEVAGNESDLRLGKAEIGVAARGTGGGGGLERG